MRLAVRDQIIAIIPARRGSKGIPGKNIKEFLGKPLLAWTIAAAKESSVFQRVILSTEDEEIAEIGAAWGADIPFLRPRELAQDMSTTLSVVRHAIEWLGDNDGWIPKFLMILEPTSPARQAFHIREAAALLDGKRADSVASVSEVPHHYVPSKQLHVLDDGTLCGINGIQIRDMIHRRQDLPKCYAFNGLIFACQTELVLGEQPSLWGNRVLPYLIDSKYNIDLDRSDDWINAEAQMRQALSLEIK